MPARSTISYKVQRGAMRLWAVELETRKTSSMTHRRRSQANVQSSKLLCGRIGSGEGLADGGTRVEARASDADENGHRDDASREEAGVRYGALLSHELDLIGREGVPVDRGYEIVAHKSSM